MKFEPTYRATHLLADGTPFIVRPIEPSDRVEIRRQFERLSPGTRYRRFFGGVSMLSDTMLDYLTNVDGVNHFALIAGIDSLDLKTQTGVAVGRFVRLSDAPDVAEAAITVIDEMQGKGIGRVLLAALADAAKERGIHRFRGEVLASNDPMRHILEGIGATILPGEGPTLVFEVSLDSTGAESPLRRALRAAADSLSIWLRHF